MLQDNEAAVAQLVVELDCRRLTPGEGRCTSSSTWRAETQELLYMYNNYVLCTIKESHYPQYYHTWGSEADREVDVPRPTACEL